MDDTGHQEPVLQRFALHWIDNRNIRLGRARLIYDDQRKGWALPGGRFTTQYDEAMRVASAINVLLAQAA